MTPIDSSSPQSPTTGELGGKVALVTGASRGIGRAIALRLGRAGACVVVNNATNADNAQVVVASITGGGGQAVAVQADISQRADVVRLFEQAQDAFGGLDIVVNNAGAYLAKPLTEVTETEFDQVFGLDARGTFFALQEAARRVRAGGRIINISSSQTVTANPNQSVYAASKAAVEQFGLALAKELGSRQITVNNVLAGITETDGLVIPEEAKQYLIQSTPLGRLGQPDDIAEVVGFLASPVGHWINAQNIRVNGGQA